MQIRVKKGLPQKTERWAKFHLLIHTGLQPGDRGPVTAQGTVSTVFSLGGNVTTSYSKLSDLDKSKPLKRLREFLPAADHRAQARCE